MSYFIGGRHSGGGYDEDGGFAINAGKGFKEVVFENHQISLNGNTAIAMGNYYFTCATTGDRARSSTRSATSAATDNEGAYPPPLVGAVRRMKIRIRRE